MHLSHRIHRYTMGASSDRGPTLSITGNSASIKISIFDTKRRTNNLSFCKAHNTFYSSEHLQDMLNVSVPCTHSQCVVHRSLHRSSPIKRQRDLPGLLCAHLRLCAQSVAIGYAPPHLRHTPAQTLRHAGCTSLRTQFDVLHVRCAYLRSRRPFCWMP